MIVFVSFFFALTITHTHTHMYIYDLDESNVTMLPHHLSPHDTHLDQRRSGQTSVGCERTHCEEARRGAAINFFFVFLVCLGFVGDERRGKRVFVFFPGGVSRSLSYCYCPPPPSNGHNRFSSRRRFFLTLALNNLVLYNAAC
jgi:hypothetical protein